MCRFQETVFGQETISARSEVWWRSRCSWRGDCQTGVDRDPKSSGSFGCVVSNSTLEHVEDDLMAVNEIARVLRSGGDFFFTVPTPADRGAVLAIAEDERGNQDVLMPEGPHHRRLARTGR